MHDAARSSGARLRRHRPRMIGTHAQRRLRVATSLSVSSMAAALIARRLPLFSARPGSHGRAEMIGVLAQAYSQISCQYHDPSARCRCTG